MGESVMRGHLLAGSTILLWGFTFVSTKILLEGLEPLEVLFLRFLLGYCTLWLLAPRLLKVPDWRHELRFAAAGATGVALYFLTENIALTYTTATNVSVVVSVAPLFTGLIAMLVLRKAKLRAGFFAGFVVALMGIVLVGVFGGEVSSDADAANAIGCGLAVVGALAWAVYCNISNAISADGYDILLSTRRTFFWGLVLLLPALPLMGFSPDWAFVLRSEGIGNLLFLGVLASATCYVTWNKAVKEIGPVATAGYIYLQPVVTIVAAMVILDEALTFPIILGVVLTIAGLVISEFKGSSRS